MGCLSLKNIWISIYDDVCLWSLWAGVPQRHSCLAAVQVLWANISFLLLFVCPHDGRIHKPVLHPAFLSSLLLSVPIGRPRSTFYSVSLGLAGARISKRFFLPVSIYRSRPCFLRKGGYEVREGGHDGTLDRHDCFSLLHSPAVVSIVRVSAPPGSNRFHCASRPPLRSVSVAPAPRLLSCANLCSGWSSWIAISPTRSLSPRGC